MFRVSTGLWGVLWFPSPTGIVYRRVALGNLAMIDTV